MLKKMRWRFIGAAMASIFAVMVFLVVTINVINYSTITSRLDTTASLLMNYEREDGVPRGDAPFPKDGPFGDKSPEARYATRFFSVLCDGAGSVLEVRRDFIGSVSESDAVAFTGDVLSGGKSAGYYGDYRYAVRYGSDEIHLVFLNAAVELEQIRSLLFISCLVALGSLMATFMLVILLSGRAISPYVKNFEMQKQFITDAGHEIKTPLTSLATSADVLAEELGQNEWVENIQRQCARLSKLVGSLVALSRLDEATPFPAKSEFSLSEAAWEASEPFASGARARGRNYSQSIENDLTIVGDKPAIQQMISILLDNALKYSDSGGQIRFDVYRRNRKNYIEVFNTCEPIDTKKLDRLFDRFYRPDSSRSVYTGGTGIGLSIARATVEGHGGKISAESKDGVSIKFTAIV